MSDMLIYAKVVLCIAHSAPAMGRAVIHGHSYEVWVYEPAVGQSAEDLQARADVVAKMIDHTNADERWGPNHGTMENIVEFFKHQMPSLSRVVVHRPVEGLGATKDWPTRTA